jgi:hypothetical protein
MKKILFTLILILPFVFNSCSKDDDDKDPSSLIGTTWECKITEDGYQNVMTFEFTKDNVKYTMIETEDGEEYTQTFTGTYTYDPPKLSITILDMTIEGTIAGNQFTVIDDGERYVFVKK